jgi:hypothetical protein
MTDTKEKLQNVSLVAGKHFYTRVIFKKVSFILTF